MPEKTAVIVRFDTEDLEIFDSYVARSGLSREEYIRQLCSLVTRLDCKPSEVEKLKKAYRGENNYV